MKLTGFFEKFQKIPELEVLSFSESFRHKPGIGGSLNSEDFQNFQFSIAWNQRFFDPEDFQNVELEVITKFNQLTNTGLFFDKKSDSSILSALPMLEWVIFTTQALFLLSDFAIYTLNHGAWIWPAMAI
jgi:hypothetical protein